MKKSLATFLIAGVTGVLLLLLLNTSPLSRLGLTIELPVGWHSSISVNDYKDSHCNDRHAEGLPFAFKRPNATQTCTFDTNKLALLLNGALGLGLGVGYAIMNTQRWFSKRS